jgi:hypothetical protein
MLRATHHGWPPLPRPLLGVCHSILASAHRPICSAGCSESRIHLQSIFESQPQYPSRRQPVRLVTVRLVLSPNRPEDRWSRGMFTAMGPTRRSACMIRPPLLSNCSTPTRCIRRGPRSWRPAAGSGRRRSHSPPATPKRISRRIDTSATSLAKARHAVAAAGLSNVTFEEADILDLPHAAGSFDDVFLCFVLEHLPRPEAALLALRRVMRPGGTMT